MFFAQVHIIRQLWLYSVKRKFTNLFCINYLHGKYTNKSRTCNIRFWFIEIAAQRSDRFISKTGAVSKSISATHMGSTPCGVEPHFTQEVPRLSTILSKSYFIFYVFIGQFLYKVRFIDQFRFKMTVMPFSHTANLVTLRENQIIFAITSRLSGKNSTMWSIRISLDPRRVQSGISKLSHWHSMILAQKG